LSSSAAIEVVSMITLLTLSGKEIPKKDIIQLSRKAENEFVGVSCGIMDQFIITLGEKDHALFLYCKTLDYKLIPIDWEDSILIIGNTKVNRGLAESKYNQRVNECIKGLKILKNKIDREEIEYLSDIKKNEFYRYKKELPSPVDKRCEHVILENERVRKAVDCLKGGDIEGLGKLLNDSHNSLRDLYEVSCKELEIIRDEALKVEGVWGARMTGAGFGGCIIILADEESKNDIINKVRENYERKAEIEPEFYICEIEGGAHEIRL
jgi:galactokinase